MSDTQHEPGWWLASDGKWYPPAQRSSEAVPPQNESKQQAKLRKSQAKLRTEVQAFLEPGEQIEAVFLSQTGPSPRGVLSVGLTSNLMRYWVVVATDRNIVICPFGQKGHVSRLPREPLEVLEDKGRRWWFPVMIGDTRHWVSAEQYEIVAAANEALRTGRRAPMTGDATASTADSPGQPAAAPAAWAPDPTHRHELRYWDGRTWTTYVSDQGAQSTDPVTTS